MLTIHLDPEQLSTEELANLSCALHARCADCIEQNVAASCMHQEQVHKFLSELAGAVDYTLRERQRTTNAQALGVDTGTGEWLPGA